MGVGENVIRTAQVPITLAGERVLTVHLTRAQRTRADTGGNQWPGSFHGRTTVASDRSILRSYQELLAEQVAAGRLDAATLTTVPARSRDEEISRVLGFHWGYVEYDTPK